MTESEQIAEILHRRANEIAMFLNDYMSDPKHYGSVELALSREIDRLRELSGWLESAEAETTRNQS